MRISDAIHTFQIAQCYWSKYRLKATQNAMLKSSIKSSPGNFPELFRSLKAKDGTKESRDEVGRKSLKDVHLILDISFFFTKLGIEQQQDHHSGNFSLKFSTKISRDNKFCTLDFLFCFRQARKPEKTNEKGRPFKKLSVAVVKTMIPFYRSASRSGTILVLSFDAERKSGDVVSERHKMFSQTLSYLSQPTR